MSQEKVEKRKELKNNRKQIAQAKKMKQTVATVAVTVVCILLVFWIGFSVYGKVSGSSEGGVAKTPVNINAITDYMDSLQETEEE